MPKRKIPPDVRKKLWLARNLDVPLLRSREARTPRGTPENRPMRDASKPANEVEAGQMQYRYIYTLAPMAATRKIAFDAYWPILVGPGRRIRQRRDATGAPIQRPECGNGAWRGGASRPSKTSYSGGKAVNPRGMGTESPSKKAFFRMDRGEAVRVSYHWAAPVALAADLVRRLRAPHFRT